MEALVIGAGHFGAMVATELARKNCEVVVIDTDANNLDDIKDQVSQVIVGDATDEGLLAKFAKDADVVVVALGERIDASVLITHRLKEMQAKRIIAKATSPDHGEILKLIGAHQVVFPERDEAMRLVLGLVSPNFVDLVRLSDEFNIVEIAVPDQFVGNTIRGLDLRRRYGFQVLAIKNALKGEVNVLPSPEYIFQADDMLVVIGDTQSLKDVKER